MPWVVLMEYEKLELVKKKLDQVSPSFCLAKWTQVTLHLYNGNTQSCHHVRSHRVPFQEVRDNERALHNSSYKRKQRRKMISGVYPKECQYCWNIEKVGEISDRIYKSRRFWAWPHFEEVVKSSDGPLLNPTNVEIAFESTCNLKCMYCSPSYSSKWHEEIRQYGAYPTSRLYNDLRINKTLPLKKEDREFYYNAFWKWWPSLSESLKVFRITGGEPLLSSHTWRTLDDIIKNPKPKLTLAVNSNMSVPDNLINRLIEKINALEGKVEVFQLFVSIDTCGKQAEYIRFGLQYEKFMENVEKILTRVKWPITISYMITVNALSLPGLKGLLKKIHYQRTTFDRHQINLDTPYLRNPEHLTIFILPKSFSSYLTLAVEYMKKNNFNTDEIDRLNRVVEYMKKNKIHFLKKKMLQADFYKMFVEYDKRKHIFFEEVFPEYKSFWSQCKKAARWFPWIKI